MTLQLRIADDMKLAMRAKDTVRLDVIRLLRAAIQRKEVDDRCELDDQAVVQVVQKLLKQSLEAADQFVKGNRHDLADKERQAVEILQAYLPEPLSAAELEHAIAEAIDKTGATTIKDMGRVMALVREQVQGRADMKQVSETVKSHLQ